MSTLNKINDKQFIKIVKSSKNIHQALLSMGLNGKGGNYKCFKHRCNRLPSLSKYVMINFSSSSEVIA